jgi:5-formyltetrahydrofolate cyclo-ligase
MGQHKRVAHAGKISGMNEIALAKAQLRSKILADRNQRQWSAVDESSLISHLLSLVERMKPARIATYISFGKEPDTRVFIDELVARGTAVLVPKVTGSDLVWFSYDKAQLSESKLGISEPNQGNPIQVDLLPSDLLLIPALAVDNSGNRLGRGKGFFDKALANLASNVVYAICFESEFIAELPSEEHDRKVQGVVTEAAIHDLN